MAERKAGAIAEKERKAFENSVLDKPRQIKQMNKKQIYKGGIRGAESCFEREKENCRDKIKKGLLEGRAMNPIFGKNCNEFKIRVASVDSRI
jgi:hypothetical protein